MAFDASLYFNLVSNLSNPLDLSTPASALAYSRQIPFTQGAGLNQADRIWHDTRTLTAAATENLDLAGILADPWGVAITFARVKGILVVAAAGNTNNVVVGNSGANAFLGPFGAAAHTVSVRPGGVWLHLAPDATAYAVTAGTGDILTVTNSAAGTPVTYDVVVIGAST